jgi:putative membrane protein
MSKLLIRWLLSAAAIAIVAWLLPSISAGTGTQGAITVGITALFLGLANAIVKPLLMMMSCPLILLTLGLFLFVINALMLKLAAVASGAVGYPLVVDGWGAALLGSILITIVTWILNFFVPDNDKPRHREKPNP